MHARRGRLYIVYTPILIVDVWLLEAKVLFLLDPLLSHPQVREIAVIHLLLPLVVVIQSSIVENLVHVLNRGSIQYVFRVHGSQVGLRLGILERVILSILVVAALLVINVLLLSVVAHFGSEDVLH